MPQQLWAKSPRSDGKILTLKQHLSETEEAAQAIFKGRILENWCRFFGVSDAVKFLIHLRIAALFHDIGKANAEFDATVKGCRKPQALSHEWFSTLILHLPSVREWLAPSGLDLEVITAAVLSHHLKAHPEDWGKPRPGTQVKPGDSIELYLNYQKYPEVADVFQQIAQIAGIEGLPELPEKWIADDRFWNQVYQDANDTGEDFYLDIQDDCDRRSLLLAVKAGVIAADSVASCMFRIDDSIEQWVNRTLHRDAITPEEVETEILQRRYRQIEQESGKPFKLKTFQERAQEQGDRVLLLSGCGTGKTIYGYKWMQSKLTRYQVGHLIFLYPTRGTATEGFKDYVSWAPESDASLLTGTASYELKGIAENPPESAKDKDFTTDERMFALGFWSKRFFAATVDQFLSFLTHSYSSLCLLPVLSDSVIVIDEVHSFSFGMFKNLISFLKNFDIPVLCMTATLPKSRQRQLVERNLQVFSSVADEELEKLENSDRYILKADIKATNEPLKEAHQRGKNTACQQAIEAYQNKNCILWVVNTVDRCRQIAADLEQKLGVDILTYHSRFKLKDRQKRHQETVAAFKFQQGERKPVIAVTTQVCEMSLDLDADVLISELAPISSLVQRFGRSNRSSERPKTFRSQVFVYEPDGVLPYHPDELEAARKFLCEVSQQGEVSPWYLAEALLRHSPRELYADGSSSFVDGGYWAISEPFRDTDAYSVDAILDSDLEMVKTLVEKHDPDVAGYVLPVPNKYAKEENRPNWMLRDMRYMKIADSNLYCPKRGFGE